MEDPEVPTEHLHEQIHEAAEHSRQRWTLGVALSSALLAGFAAVASLMAGHEANEAMLSQISSANQWNYYQAKGIKEAQLTSKADILERLASPSLARTRQKSLSTRKKRSISKAKQRACKRIRKTPGLAFRDGQECNLLSNCHCCRGYFGFNATARFLVG